MFLLASGKHYAAHISRGGTYLTITDAIDHREAYAFMQGEDVVDLEHDLERCRTDRQVDDTLGAYCYQNGECAQ